MQRPSQSARCNGLRNPPVVTAFAIRPRARGSLRCARTDLRPLSAAPPSRACTCGRRVVACADLPPVPAHGRVVVRRVRRCTRGCRGGAESCGITAARRRVRCGRSGAHPPPGRTPAAGMGSPRPHLRRDWAHSLSHLRQGLARPCHICTRTGLAPATSAPGPGLTPATSATRLGARRAVRRFGSGHSTLCCRTGGAHVRALLPAASAGSAVVWAAVGRKLLAFCALTCAFRADAFSHLSPFPLWPVLSHSGLFPT